jgi:hypothetical protein
VQRRTFTVADVSDVAVQGLNVVPIRIEQVSRVVTRSVDAVPRRIIRPKTGLDSRTVEGINLLFTPRVEPEMHVGGGGRLSMTLRFVKSVQAELHVPCLCSAIFGIPSGDKTVS